MDVKVLESFMFFFSYIVQKIHCRLRRDLLNIIKFQINKLR